MDRGPIDYQAVCEQLQLENEGLRASLDRLNRLSDTIEDVRHVAMKAIQPFRKNPYLLIVACYIVISFLDFSMRRMHHEE